MVPMTTEYTGRLTAENRKDIDLYKTVYSVRKIAKLVELPYSQVRRYVEWRDENVLGLLPAPDGPKILVFDIETAPMNVWAWNLWKTNVIAIERDWYMLSFAYGWYNLTLSDIEGTDFVSIFQDPKFFEDTTDDTYVLRRLWKLLDEADIIIGHNVDQFDLKKANARFSEAGMPPPTPYQTIDTLKEDRRFFNRSAHSLKHLTWSLKLTLKQSTEGFALWRKCMAGDPEAWEIMEEYNRIDVQATADLYTRLRPWIGMPGKKAHPNLGLYIESDGWVCPKCGNTDEKGFTRRGYYTTNARRYAQVQCKACGAYSRLAGMDTATLTTELR